MITVKIPAAIRVCSPVILVDPLDTASHLSGRRGTVHARSGNVCSFAIDGVESVVIAGADSLALIISDPTGAAHLAWWLLYGSPPVRPGAEHSAILHTIGAGATEVLAIVQSAGRGDGDKMSRRALEILRDYAHRVAGVTNG